MDKRKILAMNILGGGESANPLFAGVVCPPIVPTIGSETLINPGFEGTYDTEAAGIDIAPNWSNSGLDASVDTAAKEVTIVHGGSASQKIIADANGEGVVTEAEVLVVGKWLQVSAWVYRESGTGSIWLLDYTAQGPVANPVGTTGVWVQAFVIDLKRAASRTLTLRAYIGGGFNGYVDDASVKEVTNMYSLLGSLSGRNGTYTCRPTVSSKTWSGMAIAYLNTTNFVLACVDQTTATLYKCIAGVWTSVITGAITYAATRELKVIISGTSYSLYYHGTQVGTTQTIADALGDDVYGFNTYVGNTVGTVTANP